MSLLFIIDGYNIINHPRFNRRAHPDPLFGLLDLIRNKKLSGSVKNNLIIVFDGFPKPASPEKSTQENKILVLYSRKISADEKIRKLVEESSNRKNIIVISDDKEVRYSSKLLGACVKSVDDFLQIKKVPYAKKAGDNKSLKEGLDYTSVSRINQELKKIWLK